MTDVLDHPGPEPEPEPGPFAYRWTIPALPPDTRPDSEVCGICIRDLKPHRAVYKHRLPVCRGCDSQPNHPLLVEWWLNLPREKRRAWIVVAHGIDPATYSEADVQAEYTEVTEDVDGIPSGVKIKTGNSAFGAGAVILPVKTFWDLWTYKHRATHYHDK